MKKKFLAALNWLILSGSTLLVCLFLGIILWDIFSKGMPALSWDFVLQFPTDGMTKGGILPALVGTVLLTFIATLFAVPFGVACAIYLNEYARPSVLTNTIRASIRNLAGIPSIIYGLFGLALFVQALQLGTSILSAGLTLGLLSLPYIITTTEEALKRIPNSMREATLALGATQFETIRDVVLPQALPGILTGVILTISRAAGETAPILFTGVAFYINGFTTSASQEFMALPYHLYVLSTQHSAIEQVRPLAYATAVVLVLLVFVLNITAFIIRFKYRTQD
ncbi:MAG: phosphate ABC transporter permease PstA [Cyclobacteriaceae bacterium]